MEELQLSKESFIFIKSKTIFKVSKNSAKILDVDKTIMDTTPTNMQNLSAAYFVF
jgi:hypothetical protein